MTTLILDNFTGTDGSDLNGRTPDTTNTPGNAWAKPTSSFFGGAAWDSLSVKLISAVDYGYSPYHSSNSFDKAVYIESGVSDCTVSTTLNKSLTDVFNNGHGLIFRAVDNAHMWAVLLFPNNNNFGAYQLTANSGNGSVQKTLVGSLTSYTPSGGGDSISVALSGSSIAITVNGVTLNLTDSTWSTATKHGLYAHDAIECTWADFTVSTSGGGGGGVFNPYYYRHLSGGGSF